MAEIYFYNHLTNRAEKFSPISDKVGLYTCGPTVYDFVHIGNLRTTIFEDVLKRVLKYNGLDVLHVMNLTDVEDKIIRKMSEEKKTLAEVTLPFTEAFFIDNKKVNNLPADVYPKATEHIEEMISLIKVLLTKGIAYEKDGSVYFSLEKFPEYGKLSKLNKREIKVGARVNVDEYDKENAEDFVLWKKTEKNEPSWEAPFGKGRPGWHIECSAMSMKYLGESFDIHAGAVDLLFPHHENEIAQSEAFTGKKFVNYWLEAEHLLVDNHKMSKSLKNIYPLRVLEERGFDPLSFRYLVLTSHYQSKLNFTWESLEAAQNALNNLYEFASMLPAEGKESSGFEERFLEAINDNLDTPKALAVVWEMVKSDRSLEAKAKALRQFDQVLGLGLEKAIGQQVPVEIRRLVDERQRLRKEGSYEEADKVRGQIEGKGYILNDTPEGVQVVKKYGT